MSGCKDKNAPESRQDKGKAAYLAPEANTLGDPGDSHLELSLGSAKYFPMVEHFDNGVSAVLIAPGVSKQALEDGLRIIDSCFTPTEPDRLASMQNLYSRMQKGSIRMIIDDPDSTDHGWDIELTGFFVYYAEKQPIGVGGLYRYMDKPDQFWLGLFGVDPAYQGRGWGRVLIDHPKGLVKRLEQKSLKVFTRDAADNTEVHAFYEKLGFQLTEEIFVEDGVSNRVYKLDL